MDIKELALKVAKEMNWRMDEMTLETFATRLIAAYLAEQEPVAWVPQFSWQRSIDAVACSSKRSFDDIPLFTAPPEPAPQMPLGVSEGTATSARAAPSSEEVAQMVEQLERGDAIDCRAADLIERLAARVPDGCVVVPKDLIDAAKNLLAVKGRHHTELAYKQLCQALIAAGEVKP